MSQVSVRQGKIGRKIFREKIFAPSPEGVRLMDEPNNKRSLHAVNEHSESDFKAE